MAARLQALLVLLLLALPAGAQAASESNSFGAPTFSKSRLTIRHADGADTAFDMEVAATEEQQETGLMFRTTLPADSGMLFLFPGELPVSIWMKDTFIPLDILFVDAKGVIVTIVANAKPQDMTPMSADVLVRAIVEINGGEALKRSIKVGDHISSPAFPAP